jgi:hypothetical protein
MGSESPLLLACKLMVDTKIIPNDAISTDTTLTISVTCQEGDAEQVAERLRKYSNVTAVRYETTMAM